jgi:cell wall-associated NlpC family hydrolase
MISPRRFRARAVAGALAITVMAGGGLGRPDVVRADGVTDAKREVQRIAAELTSLNDRIAMLDEEYGAALDLKTSLDGEIAVSRKKVAAEQSQLGKLQGTMTDIAVSRFTGSNQFGLSPLFSSASNFTNAQQFDALSAIAFDNGAGSADDLQSLVRRLDNDTARLQRQQKKATDLIATLKTKKQQGSQLITEYTQKAASAKAKYGEAVQQEADRQATANAQRQAAAAARQSAQSNGNGNSNGNGGQSATPAPRGGGGGASGNGNGNGNGGATGGGNSSSGDSNIPMPPPPSGRAGLAVAAAQRMLGVPYVAFEASPSAGFDCSGLTMWAWAQAGVGLPHQSGRQYASNPHVPKNMAQAGDLLFFYSPIHHVGIYIGGGVMIDAPHTGAVVRTRVVNWAAVVGVARPG